MIEPELTPSQRLRAVLDMAGFGVRMMEQNLRREHPQAPDAEIERLLTEWIQTRPGAELGDCSGTTPWRSRAGG
jgi:hypothetical protein